VYYRVLKTECCRVAQLTYTHVTKTFVAYRVLCMFASVQVCECASVCACVYVCMCVCVRWVRVSRILLVLHN